MSLKDFYGVYYLAASLGQKKKMSGLRLRLKYF